MSAGLALGCIEDAGLMLGSWAFRLLGIPDAGHSCCWAFLLLGIPVAGHSCCWEFLLLGIPVAGHSGPRSVSAVCWQALPFGRGIVVDDTAKLPGTVTSLPLKPNPTARMPIFHPLQSMTRNTARL